MVERSALGDIGSVADLARCYSSQRRATVPRIIKSYANGVRVPLPSSSTLGQPAEALRRYSAGVAGEVRVNLVLGVKCTDSCMAPAGPDVSRISLAVNGRRTSGNRLSPRTLCRSCRFGYPLPPVRQHNRAGTLFASVALRVGEVMKASARTGRASRRALATRSGFACHAEWIRTAMLRLSRVGATGVPNGLGGGRCHLEARPAVEACRVVGAAHDSRSYRLRFADLEARSVAALGWACRHVRA